MIRKLPNLEILFENHNLLTEHLCVNGIQFLDDSFIIFFNQKYQSSESPHDWNGCLQKISFDTYEIEAEYNLGPGNWRLVKGGEGTDKIILYDCTEDQGILALSTDLTKTIWHTVVPSVRRVDYSHNGELSGVLRDRTCISINNSTGKLNNIELPVEDFNCSFITFIENVLFAGGFSDNKESYVLLKYSNQQIEVKTIPLNTIFDQQKIEFALADEECCGADIYEVSHIIPIDNDCALITFGGNGVDLGTDGGTAVGIVDLKTLRILESKVLDEEDSCSGIAKIQQGRYLINCCSSEYIVDVEP